MYIDDSIHIEKTDQCYTCEHFIKNVTCPLLEALALGVVELTGDMTVQNCSFYKRFSRHLRVIETGSPSGDESEATQDDDENSAKSHFHG
jgi:hypothetical protein